MRIGQYEVIREIGRGGMGVVLLARDDRLGRRVAIKFLRVGDAEVTQRFITEARATARCSHPNIVVIHEVGQYKGSPFMVLEYLQGQTLASALRKDGPIPVTRAVEVITSVLQALVCAHEQGIVHRDLKPENIMLMESGLVKVLDFGIAKALQDDSREAKGTADGPPWDTRMSRRSGVVGTMAYMSPEQWDVGDAIDGRTDIWAVGVILFEMLSGKHPLELSGTDPQPWAARLDTSIPSLREIAPQVPLPLADLVGRCLRKRKAERVQDAGSLLRELEPFLPGHCLPSELWRTEGPYPGQRSFEKDDEKHFFGRSRDISAFRVKIRDWPLMVVVGPPGVGKSSFVQAGIVPELERSGENWKVLACRPGADPVKALARLLEPLLRELPDVVEDLAMHKEIRKHIENEPEYLDSVLRTTARRNGGRILVFVDQFEEIYTQGAEGPARQLFTRALMAAGDDPTSAVRVVVAVRNAYFPRISEDRDFMRKVGKGVHSLGVPDREDLQKALVQPIEMAGYRFETLEIIQEIITDLGSVTGALPLLQLAASRLWERRDAQRRLITYDSYRAMGGVAGALVDHADHVMAKLPPDLRSMCTILFLALITPERTRAVREMGDLDAMSPENGLMRRLVDHLIDARLLVTQVGGASGNATAELVHESLITHWPTLRRWLEESHHDIIFLDQLCTASRNWQIKGRDPRLLWRGDMVETLRRFLKRKPVQLPEAANAFAIAIFDSRRFRQKFSTLLSWLPSVGPVAPAVLASLPLELSDRKPWPDLSSLLPTTLKPHAAIVERFLRHLFVECESIGDGSISLRGSSLPGADMHSFFAVFMGDSQSRLGTCTFLNYAKPLQAYLVALDRTQQKVVLAIVDSMELGEGVRQQIFEFYRDYRATVLPLHIGQLREARTLVDCHELIRVRLHDLHALPDVFAPRRHEISPTNFFGMRLPLNELTESLTRRGAFISIHGPPGSGKSSLISMAKYGSKDLSFYVVNCDAVPHRLSSLTEALISALSVPPQADGKGSGLDGAIGAAATKARATGRQVVLVLEDIDWLLSKLCCSPGIPVGVEEREEARAFFSLLGRHVTEQVISVVTTSLRGFVLKKSRLGDWYNPVARVVHDIAVPPLSSRDLRTMIRELGREMNVEFHPDAFVQIYLLSAGNLDVARRLCSNAVQFFRKDDNTSPLEAIRIDRSSVNRVGQDLAQAAFTFGDTLQPRLEKNELDVLYCVASQQSGIGRTHRLLSDQLDRRACTEIFDSLAQMQLIARRGWKARITMPLLKEWVLRNLPAPQTVVASVLRSWTQRVAFCLTALWLLFGLFWIETSRRRNAVYCSTDCRYVVNYPGRALPEKPVSIWVSRTCAPGLVAACGANATSDGRANATSDTGVDWTRGARTRVAKRPLKLKALDETFLVEEAPLTLVLDADASGDWMQKPLSISFREAGAGEFGLEVVDKDGKKIGSEISIKEDWVAALPLVTRTLANLLGGLATFVAVITTWYSNVAKAVGNLLGRWQK